MSFKNKCNMGSNFDAQIQRGTRMGGRMKAHGEWMFRNHGPILVANRLKFEAIVQQQGLVVPKFATSNTIHLKAWDKLRSILYSRYKPALGELERLLSGGQLVWEAGFGNLVVNDGLDDVLDKYLKGSSYTASHFIGLTDSTPTVAATDTMSSHTGWTEIHTQYDESTRPAYNNSAAVSGQSHDNSGNPAQYSINTTVTIGGGFLTTDSTKNGTTGTLYSVGAFSGGDKAVGNGDTLSITATLTQADDGV